jgi:hypothetical protein
MQLRKISADIRKELPKIGHLGNSSRERRGLSCHRKAIICCIASKMEQMNKV